MSSGLSIITKGVAFVMQILIAYYFGANIDTDIYFYLFNLVILLGNIVQAITVSVLIPRYTYLSNNVSAKEGIRYINAFIYTIIGILGCVMLVAAICSDGTMAFISNFNIGDIHRNLSVFYYTLLMGLLYTLNIMLSEVLIANKFFTSSLFSNLILNVGIIISLLLSHSLSEVSLMMKAACISSGFTVLIFVILMKKELNWTFGYTKMSYINASKKDVMYILGNQVGMFIENSFPLFLLSQYQAGLITIINYAYKLIQTPLALVMQIVAVLQIKFNELASRKEYDNIRRLAYNAAWKLFGVVVLVAIFIYILRNLIAEIIYGIGNISSLEIDKLASLIGILACSIPFTVWGLVYGKVHFACQYIKQYSILMSILYGLSCIIYYFLISSYQEVGYAYTYVLTELLIALFLYVNVTRKRMP